MFHKGWLVLSDYHCNQVTPSYLPPGTSVTSLWSTVNAASLRCWPSTVISWMLGAFVGLSWNVAPLHEDLKYKSSSQNIPKQKVTLKCYKSKSLRSFKSTKSLHFALQENYIKSAVNYPALVPIFLFRASLSRPALLQSTQHLIVQMCFPTSYSAWSRKKVYRNI